MFDFLDAFPIVPFFVLGGLAFWILLAVVSLCIAVVMESECYKASFFMAFVFFAAWFLFGDLRNEIAATADVKETLIRWTAIYAAGGIVWGVARWIIFLVARRMKYEKLKSRFLSDRKAVAFTQETKAEFIKWIIDISEVSFFSDGYFYPWREGGEYNGKLCITPKATHNAGRITAWMMYWPVSIAAWTLQDAARWLVCDVVRYGWRCVQSWTAAVYDAIAHQIMGDAEKELK